MTTTVNVVTAMTVIPCVGVLLMAGTTRAYTCTNISHKVIFSHVLT
jgi:hypothetical protein